MNDLFDLLFMTAKLLLGLRPDSQMFVKTNIELF